MEIPRASWLKYFAVALLVILLYVVYSLYENFYGCGDRPCPEVLAETYVRNYPNCTNPPAEICPFDLDTEWKNAKCSIDLPSSLVYRIHITNNPDGSLRDFDCEFGPQYTFVASTPSGKFIKECSRETAESIDSAAKGTNKTPIEYVGFIHVFPPHFNDYYFTTLACHKYSSGRFSGQYVLLTFINFSGNSYN